MVSIHFSFLKNKYFYYYIYIIILYILLFIYILFILYNTNILTIQILRFFQETFAFLKRILYIYTEILSKETI